VGTWGSGFRNKQQQQQQTTNNKQQSFFFAKTSTLSFPFFQKQAR
jgi:hypothetical protein